MLYQTEPHSDLPRAATGAARGSGLIARRPFLGKRLIWRVASCVRFGYLARSPALPGRAGPAGEWCNGNTAVFGTVILGSSPSSPATDVLQQLVCLGSTLRIVNRHSIIQNSHGRTECIRTLKRTALAVGEPRPSQATDQAFKPLAPSEAQWRPLVSSAYGNALDLEEASNFVGAYLDAAPARAA